MASASIQLRHGTPLQREPTGIHAIRSRTTASVTTAEPSKSWQHGSTTAAMLSERVYRWSIHDLDYRPRTVDTRARSNPVLHSSSPLQGQEFGPHTLEGLCEGPCAPILQHLVNSIKPRSVINKAQSDQQTAERQERRQELESKLDQCRELAHTVAQRQQDIRNIKERIKQQRQMQSIKDAFHQQSSLKVRMYSELQTRLHQLQPGAQDHSDSHKLKAILDICLNEISRIARTIAVEGATLSSNHLPDGVRVQDLYRLIHESDEGGAHFFSGIQRAKESRLSLLVAVEQDRFQKTLDRDEALEAPELIQLFRDHHLERVVQIESVFNKLSACEREMDELYTRMRFQTQQREHEGKPALFYQKLEEVKAHLKGVGIALEFIQAEQENLVERVVSQDEQETTLEAISRASRAADLKTLHVRQVIHRLVEMINISLETRSRTGGALQEITTRSLSEGLSELSSLAQDLQHTAEEDSTVLQNMAQQSRRFVTGSYDGAACACMPERQRSDLNPGLWQEIVAASCLSSDQHHLQIARSQRFNTAQRLAILKARKDNAHMSTQKDGITTTLNALISGLQGTQGRMNSASNARGHFVSVDSLSSAFEYMVKNMSGSLMHLEDRQHAEFQKDLQHIVQTTISGGTLVKSIQGLVEDECAVAERFAITKKPSSVHKKIRYM